MDVAITALLAMARNAGGRILGYHNAGARQAIWLVFSSHEPRGLQGDDKLNYGTFYQANVWVLFKRPAEARTLMGTKRVRAIGLSLDDPRAFMDALADAAGCDCG